MWDASVVVRLDDIYPGWDGLAWAVDHIHTELLAPRSMGRAGRWRGWDWTTNAPRTGMWSSRDSGSSSRAWAR